LKRRPTRRSSLGGRQHFPEIAERVSRFEQALEVLERLRLPCDLSFRRDGAALAVAVQPAVEDAAHGLEGRLWLVSTTGEQSQLTHGPGSEALPRFSPIDGRLAFASDRATRGRMAPYLLQPGAEPLALGQVPGSVEEMKWTPDGSSLLVLAADRGLDAAPTHGAARLWWGDAADPDVFRAGDARRRLYQLSLADGACREVGPPDLSLWDFDLLDRSHAVILASAEAAERGWYDAHLAVLDLERRSARPLFKRTWQLQGPAVAPSGRRVAVIEGWGSDRGLVAGEIRLIDIESGRVADLAPQRLSDIAFVRWRDDDSLWFAGWREAGSHYGLVRTDGEILWEEQEDAIVGLNSFLAHVAPAPGNEALAAVREAPGKPAEIVYRATPKSSWTVLSHLNDGIAESLPDYPELRAVEWPGAGGLPIRGLLLLPPEPPAGPMPLILDIHGGPTWSFKHGFNPGSGLPFAHAGYAVLMPNYRGSVGRGQAFTRLNVGDPAGAEFEDILRGVDWCVQQGIADPARIGVTGVSYGGYLTAWAAATSDRFRAAVMISGISDLLSYQYTANNGFSAAIIGAPFHDRDARRLYLERSPLLHVSAKAPPTLILHGADDHCTPLGQAEEFYRALLDHGVPAELVVYAREGHGFKERVHHADAWRRKIAWFDRHLRDRA
jgi:dipeptidyl aminopeptidase/acylaminoacyl peptidase